MFYLKARFDGIKLRGLGTVKSPDSFVEFSDDGPHEIRWAIPPAPVKHSPKLPLLNVFDTQFVRAFDWNKPGTLGYSFLVLRDVILQINSHQAGMSAAPEEYDRFHYQPVTRLYLAMSPGEYVSELWVRTCLESLATLIVVTNHGRSLVVGTQAHRPGAMYHVVAELPQNKTCRMFHSESYSKGISWLHFDSVSTWEHPAQRSIHSDLLHAPSTIDHLLNGPRLQYHTSAKLDGVREVTACIFAPGYYPHEGGRITGLLLTYTDGSRSSVGQVRPDTLGTQKTVTSGTMYLQYDGDHLEHLGTNSHRVEHGFDWFGFSEPLPLVSSNEEGDKTGGESDGYEGSHPSEDVSTDEDEESVAESVTYTNTIAVPMTGRLDWNKDIHDGRYAVSYHRGSASEDEMRHVLAEHANMAKQEPVVKPLSILIGDIDPEDLDDIYQYAESNGNYDIFGL